MCFLEPLRSQCGFALIPLFYSLMLIQCMLTFIYLFILHKTKISSDQLYNCPVFQVGTLWPLPGIVRAPSPVRRLSCEGRLCCKHVSMKWGRFSPERHPLPEDIIITCLWGLSTVKSLLQAQFESERIYLSGP